MLTRAIRLFRNAAFVVAATLLLWGAGCRENQRVVEVDFEKFEPPLEVRNDIGENDVLKVAVAAMTSPQETYVSYRQLLAYLAAGLGLRAHFVQRKTYEEINAMFACGELDLAFVCSGPYVLRGSACGFDAVAVPQIRGKTVYRSYLIVHRESPYRNLQDLRGGVFAFSDPESNTGYLVPLYWLNQMGEKPEHFFEKTLFTHSHDNSILAVSRSLVDAAAVHEQIWEYLNRKNDKTVANTRVVWQSEFFGNPPVVVSRALSQEVRKSIREILLSMHRDPNGLRLLKALAIDRFVEPQDRWYEPIRRMYRAAALSAGQIDHENQIP